MSGREVNGVMKMAEAQFKLFVGDRLELGEEIEVTLHLRHTALEGNWKRKEIIATTQKI